MTRKILVVGVVLAAAAAAAAAAMADAGDPPSRVARLNYLNGPVSFRPGGVEEWASATLNYPLTTGDYLWADAGAQAEMHIGSTAIRLDSLTAISFLNLDDRGVQLSVTAGAVNVHVRYLAPEESFEVDTPNVAISLLRPGDYRIDADGDANTTVLAVRAGEAEVTGNGAAFPVRAGESARIAGVESVSQEMGGVPPPDGFDRWCQSRDRREDSAQSARYVPREMIGYEDLDQYGVWRQEGPYGWVWVPAVQPGWAPYRYGHWAWVSPWGWTWIDDAPWGFAPFHYGRWAFVGGEWVWVPGAMAARPVYAPALVAFVGGPRFGVAVGMGGAMTAWFPLGPGEVFRPGYAVSEVYVRQINVASVPNVTVINQLNVTNVRYMNQAVPGAVVAVPQEAFVTARPVARVAVVVPAREMVAAPVVGSAVPIAPRRESVLAGPPVRMAPPAMYAQRPVMVRNAPPPAPIPWTAREQAIRANGGRPLDAAQVETLHRSVPAANPMVRAAGPVHQVQPGNDRPLPARPAFERNDRPAPAAAPPAERPAAQTNADRPAKAKPAHKPPKAEKKDERKQQ